MRVVVNIFRKQFEGTQYAWRFHVNIQQYTYTTLGCKGLWDSCCTYMSELGGTEKDSHRK